MTSLELIEKARREGRKTLNETESKQVLASYGVPVVEDHVAHTPEEAAQQAGIVGFPIVLKGLGSKLTHKTEMGLVRLGLTGADEVMTAARKMAETAGADLEGWLVQSQLKGRREFVAGLFQDNQFGAVIMFGLGGVFTEALDDVVFRIAPLDEEQAGRMLDEITSKKLLGDFRGERAVDREKLIKALVGLSRLSEELPDVAEIDINPLLITAEGQPVAVDALIVLGDEKQAGTVRPPVDPAAILAMFEPKSIAFVGATAEFRKWGQMLFTDLSAGGYEGQFYLVNPKGKPIARRTVYKSVSEIPGPVDLAIVTIPAAAVFGLLPDFKAKGIRNVIVVSSGFSEVGDEGRALERKLVEEARKNDLLILGPNTMGIINPHRKIYCTPIFVRPQSGGTSFVAQSGNLGAQLLGFAQQQGIGIRAFAGSGNEAMITIEDVLEAFGKDPETNAVLLYLESVKNGRRFFETARRVSREKPLVVLKGGRTQAGGRAAASHTGAMASNSRVFEAVCRQAGIISVKETTDLLDLSAVFSYLPLPKGRRVAIMTMGGGWGVLTADLCNEYRLEVPVLPPELVERIGRRLPPFWSRGNPLDLVAENDPDLPPFVLEELARWDGCDAIIHLGMYRRTYIHDKVATATKATDPDIDHARLDVLREELLASDASYLNQTVRLMEEYGKPIIGISMNVMETVLDSSEGGRYKAVFFQTPERGVKALARMYKYHFLKV